VRCPQRSCAESMEIRALRRPACFALLRTAAPLRRGSSRTAKRLGEARALQQKGSLREAENFTSRCSAASSRAAIQAGLGSALNSLSQIATPEGDYGGAAGGLAKPRTCIGVGRQERGDSRGHNIGVCRALRRRHQPALAHFQVALALLPRQRRRGAGRRTEQRRHAFYYQARYLDALRSTAGR